VDGISGDETEAAVRVFQELHGLDVDGDPGPNTVKVLESL
jgi:peptidoglycan hydrolase-like protein with peptidoglycan-binding domain